jgi:hypothetical protein
MSDVATKAKAKRPAIPWLLLLVSGGMCGAGLAIEFGDAHADRFWLGPGVLALTGLAAGLVAVGIGWALRLTLAKDIDATTQTREGGDAGDHA